MATITTLNELDWVDESRAALNSNFSALNTAKVEGAASLTTVGYVVRVSAAGVVGQVPISVDESGNLTTIGTATAATVNAETAISTPLITLRGTTNHLLRTGRAFSNNYVAVYSGEYPDHGNSLFRHPVDAFMFQPAQDFQYWDGSAWVSWPDIGTAWQYWFDGDDATFNGVDYTHRKFRLTVPVTAWNHGGIVWTYHEYPNRAYSLTVESSVDGTSWTTRGTGTFADSAANADAYLSIDNPLDAVWLRLTYDVTITAGQLFLVHRISYLHHRKMQQGAGNLPFNWDFHRNIYTRQRVVAGGDKTHFVAAATLQGVGVYTLGNEGGQVVAVDYATPSKMLSLLIDGSANKAQIMAVNSGSSYLPILINPFGGNVAIGTTDDGGYRLRVAGGGAKFDQAITFPDGQTQSVALTTQRRYRTLGLTIDGGGSTIPTGSKGYLYVPFDCVIDQWVVLGNATGSVAVDVKRSTYAAFPTTTSIVGGGGKPALSSAQKAQSSPTGWTSTALSAGDVIEFVVDSVATLTRISVALRATV